MSRAANPALASMGCSEPSTVGCGNLLMRVEHHPSAVCLGAVDHEPTAGNPEDELLDPVEDGVEDDPRPEAEGFLIFAMTSIGTVMNEDG